MAAVINDSPVVGFSLALGGSAYAITVGDVLVSEDYGIVELAAPKSWQGHSIRELNVRAKYKVNLIAIRRNGNEHDLQMTPGADYVISPDDVIVTLGRYEDIDLLHEL